VIRALIGLFRPRRERHCASCGTTIRHDHASAVCDACIAEDEERAARLTAQRAENEATKRQQEADARKARQKEAYRAALIHAENLGRAIREAKSEAPKPEKQPPSKR
jgi:hypothetical protein